MARLTKEEQEERIKAKKAARAAAKKSETSETNDTIDNNNAADNSIEDNYKSNKNAIKIDPKASSNLDISNEPLLQAKTTEKPYAKDNVHIIGDIPNSVPEDIIETPTIDLTSHDPEPERPPIEHGEVRNPAWDDMSKKQQTQGSEYVAENLINGYVALNNLAKDYVSFDQSKYLKKALEGKFDMDALSMELPISEDGKTIPILQLLNDVNEMAERSFKVSEKFKNEVRPLLNSLCKEKGWGLSPGQQLAIIVGKDALPKTIQVFQIKKTMDYFLQTALQLLGQYRELNQQRMNMPPPNMTQPGTTITNASQEGASADKDKKQTKISSKNKTEVIAEKKESGE